VSVSFAYARVPEIGGIRLLLILYRSCNSHSSVHDAISLYSVF